jgi:hypothetical protein
LLHAALLVSIEICHAAESKTSKRTFVTTCNTTYPGRDISGYYKIGNCPSNGMKEKGIVAILRSSI